METVGKTAAAAAGPEFFRAFYLLRLSDEGMRGLFFGLVGKRYGTGSQTGEAVRGT